MALRIAYLIGEYPRATDTFIQREIRSLRKLGTDIATFSVRRPSSRERGGSDLDAERANTTYLLPCSIFRLIGSHLRLLLQSPSRYFRAVRLAIKTPRPGMRAALYQLFYFAEAGVLARAMQSRGLTHVHNHSGKASAWVAMLAAEMSGITYSLTIHGPSEFLDSQHWRLSEKAARASFVACISNFCRSQIMLAVEADIWPNLHIVHCGVETQLFSPAKKHSNGRNVLYVGRLASVKGLGILLDAMAGIIKQQPATTLTVIGDGPERQHMETRAAQLNIEKQVTFLGYQTEEQVRHALTTSDVLALASFAEGLPVVLMEALAASVPVVAPWIAGIPELVQDGISGVLYAPGDTAALAAGISRLLSDDQLRSRMGTAGRQVVLRDFDIDEQAKILHRHFSHHAPTDATLPVLDSASMVVRN
jgi:glycosyltransferase involved in cell wall biosynthesis